MPRWEDQVLDEYRRPVPGAEVFVFTNDGVTAVALTDDGGLPLANPVETDAYGTFYFNVAASGIYQLEVHYGGETEYKQTIYIGLYNVPDGAITTVKIADNAVTLAKMADVGTATVFYRKSAGTGDPEVQPLATLKTDLGLTGINSGDQLITLTGDVTGSGTGNINAQIAAGAVGAPELANGAIEAKLGYTPAANTIFTSVAAGLAPASGGGALNFLRADGTWGVPPGTAANTAIWGLITGTLSNQTDLQTALNGKAALVHTHIIGDVTGLQAALDAKASTALVTSGAAGLAPATGGGTVNFLRADGTWAAPPGGGSSIVGITGTLAQFNTACTDADFFPTSGGTITGGITATGATINGLIATAGATGGIRFDDRDGAGSIHLYNFNDTLRVNVSAVDRFTVSAAGNATVQGSLTLADEAYGPAWDGKLEAPTKNAVYDKIQSIGSAVDDTAYGSSWDGVTSIAPSKNAVYDKIEALSVGGGGVTTFNTRSGAVTLTSADVTAAMPAFTGDVTNAAGAVASTITAKAVTLAKMADMATASLIYRKTAGSGAPEVNSLATLKTDLAIGITDISGTLAQFNTALSDHNFAVIGQDNNFTASQSINAASAQITINPSVGSSVLDMYGAGGTQALRLQGVSGGLGYIRADTVYITKKDGTVNWGVFSSTGLAVTGQVTVTDEAYGASWDGKLEVPTKNAVYDKIQTLGAGGVAWGAITGTLSSQTDLNTALNAKAPLASPALTGSPTIGGLTPLKLANAAYVGGSVTVSSSAASGGVDGDIWLRV